MLNTKSHSLRNPVVTACPLVISLLLAAGCGDNDSSISSQTGQGKLILTMHDAPVDSFSEIWMTVESATLIRADAEPGVDQVDLDVKPLRMDFLALDSISTILVSTEIDADMYSKIRLEVADPEFVRDDDSVFTEPDVQLVANGHVDINVQGGVMITPETVTVVDLDFDLQNAVQVNQTGNGRYILRPQILVDTSPDSAIDVSIRDAMVISVDEESNTLTIVRSGTEHSLVVQISDKTAITLDSGLPIQLATLTVGTNAQIEGQLDVSTGVVTASAVSVNL